MAQPPSEQSFYHHPQPHTHPHPQLQLPPQFRNPFDLLFDERTGAINYNYMRPYLPSQLSKQDELADSLVMRRPRRTRTTFTSTQIAELEQHFLQGRYLTSARLTELSSKLSLGTAQVKIWFKNRRRRHKIQSDQQKDQTFSCDGMHNSPIVPSAIKAEQHNSNTTSGVQNLNLGSSGGSTPTTLTPSPTPTTPTQSNLENYNESFNPYFYNSIQTGQHTHAHQFPPTVTSNVGQYLTPNTSLHHHSVQHHQQFYRQQYDFQHEQIGCHSSAINSIKDDSDFNYNSGYYINVASNESTLSDANISVNQVPTVISPKNNNFEMLTSKREEFHSANNCIRPKENNASNTVAERQRYRPLQQALLNSGPSFIKNSCSSVSGTVNLMEECSGTFTKYNKVPCGEANDPNYQCTMDTILQAYNNHRNNSSSTQFAYCFN